MKTFLQRTLVPICCAALAAISTAQEPDKRFVVLPIGDLPTTAPKPVPLFFSVAAEVKAQAGPETITSEQRIDFKIHQGKAETLTLALSGNGEVASVTGDGLRDWSVRVEGDGARFLDLRPVIDTENPPTALQVIVKTRAKAVRPTNALLLPAPGSATGFSLKVVLAADEGTELRIGRAEGLVPVEQGKVHQFLGHGVASLEFATSPAGFISPDIELTDTKLTGLLAADGNSVSFRLETLARAGTEGVKTRLIEGVALSGNISGEGWHVELDKAGYNLVTERGGDFPVVLDFVVPVKSRGDWRTLDFKVPAGTVVPVGITGLAESVTFDRSLSVVPEHERGQWRGFLPADGAASAAWRAAGEVAAGALFFSSTESSDVRVGSGLMRQLTTLDLRVLQGEIRELNVRLEGPGEILAVTGDPVLGWKVVEEAGARRLEVRLSRPIEGTGRIIIEAQAALGGFPVKSGALRMLPQGSLRHSGALRVANDGAVRIEVAEATGLIQLAPGQFPGGVDDTLRQVFVYRFPSADYGYSVSANQVLPEVSVTEVTVYELAETDRKITADIELDIREAPLREWEMEIPSDHAVASVTGAQVADYAVASEEKDGRRRLKILFKQAVAERQLVAVRLEKNEAAKAGVWDLPALGFPGAKSRRGYVGAIAAAGYRLDIGKTAGVAEVPVTFFPKKTGGLQQAFRLREGLWQVSLDAKALGQSLQADVFHLYSLKAGAVYGSVLVNYFVVGAPASEWRISVPPGIGNIDVTGQYVSRDWRREGDTVIVPLSRPLLGTGTVLLTFEQPMSERGGDLSPGVVSPLGVQAERGYIHVVSPLQVKFEKPVGEGSLLEIDASELPAEFRLLSSAPSLGAWQYTARDFRIGMKVEWFEPGNTVEQSVDFMKLESKISRDGQWVTDAGFFVKSRGRTTLRTTLPPGAVLWDARVNGGAVNAQNDGGATLIPLPPKTDPNEAVEISLRYGAAGEEKEVELAAPLLEAPVIIGEWRVTGDDGRQLVPRGGTAELLRSGLAENGWSWLARNPLMVGGLILAALVSVAAGSAGRSLAARRLSLLAGVVFIAVAGIAAMSSPGSATGSSAPLEYSVPVMSPGHVVSVVVGNLTPWQASAGWGMWALFLAGIGLVACGAFLGGNGWRAAGVTLIAAATLMVRGGAPLFFAMAALVAVVWLLPEILKMMRGKGVAVSAMVVCLTVIGLGDARAEKTPSLKPAESMVHDWRIREGRLQGTVEVCVRAEAGERFLFLRSPAVLRGFEGEGLRVVKEQGVYFLVAEKDGRLTGESSFEMPLADPAKAWGIPAGPAAMRQVTLRWDQPGWEFFSAGAAKVEAPAGLGVDESGAVMVLGPADPVTVQARPKQRDVATEATRFFSEVSNLYLPGPGVVNGRHKISIRPAQGRVASLLVTVPEGFTVSDVIEGPAGAWRFDPEKRELRVSVEPAQERAFSLTVETQRGTGSLPLDLQLEPLRVEEAGGEIGFLALAFGEDAQPESVDVTGLSRVNPEDFTDTLLPRDAEGNPLVVMQHVFRYGSGEVGARVRVSPVAPELRAETWQLVSLGEDRLVVSTDLNVTITRSGVFRLEVAVPDGLEVETVTGESLSHWSASEDKRTVSLHLAGKTIGRRAFNLTLTARPPGNQDDWQVPRISLRGASRETGVLTVVPERGLQVRVTGRNHVSQMESRELSEAPKESAQAAKRPGALAYRLLQGDWSLGLSISRLNPWVTAQVFHESTLREGQLLSRVVIGYKIENASVKSLRVRIPGLDETAAATVRASGSSVAGLVPVEGEPGLWEIRFQRGVAGDANVELEYQRAGKETGVEMIEPLVLQQVNQTTYFAAIRAGGRLELVAGNPPRGWQKSDWAVVQATLGQAAGTVAPAMAFRVADPEGSLPVTLKRHELADIHKLRVSEGQLTTLMSPEGVVLTAVDLKMKVVEKGTLRLKLPAGASLFNVLVNGEGATLVRAGEDWLFHVFPAPEAGRPASVRFVYSAANPKESRLEGPLLNVPMENLTWRVLVPEGWRMKSHSGDFDLKQQAAGGRFRLEDYQSFMKSKKQIDSRNAVALLDQANGWLAAGDQEKASQAFSNAVRSNQLDAASGEDARVQLRELKTEQAVLGLNTRRQKMVMDNRGETPQADRAQLDRAVEANPVLRGNYNYDPKQFNRFFEGNTADENSALKEIANRIVTQQLAAEPAPVSLDIVLPERGTVLTFGRSVQTKGERPMSIDLKLKRTGNGIAWLAIVLCALLGGMGWTMSRTRPAA
ncbi:hypothetical protein JIN84_19530 [Luteolibacter yonseiensis]|uniref:Uncharacterized protein n=1 Tax=Luteolibacter yonseiensis TaxID=1144680 RepID=A0A934VDA7_9BACT|nr:hypothetical protein [Luteolibacter yonseiensis]MBK1817821.1 hypothetical protein [Luteolibacter yonseiensis]